MNPKSGLKSTEFYLVVASYILSGLVMTGAISQPTADQLTQPLAVILTGLMTLGSTIAYIKSRTELKQALIDVSTPPATETVPAVPAQPTNETSNP